MSVAPSDRTRVQTLPGEFALESGESIPEVQVAYRTWGEPRPEATLICHALTGNADADEWWSGMFGSGRAFDPSSDFIVASNVLGGCYGTTGPSTPNPETRQAYRGSFPRVTIRDMVRIQAALLDSLGVTRLRLVIGGSMGGMQATEFAVSYPEMVEGVVSIGAGVYQSAWAMAFAAPQRAAILNDTAFNDGYYSEGSGPAAGLATARMIAMISYRGHANFEARFGRATSKTGYEVENYLTYQGRKLVERFDANSYLRLLDAMDSHDLTRGKGNPEVTLSEVHTPVMAIGISTDVLFPPCEVRDLANALPNGRYATLHAPQGHDAFLIETEALNKIVNRFKDDLRNGPIPISTRALHRAKGAAWA